MKDRSYIVTHAAQPVARDIARALAERGARVYALAFPGEGEIPFGIPCRADGYGPGEIGRALDRADSVDGIVNTALFRHTSRLTETGEAEWKSVVDSVVKGAYYATGFAVRRMCESGRGGSVVNIGTYEWKYGFKDSTLFASACGALHTLSAYVSRAYADRGIRSNWISLPRIGADVRGDRDAFFARAYPKGARVPGQKDVVSAALFLLSDEGAALTGSNLECTAGYGYPLNV